MTDDFKLVRYGIDGKELDPPMKLWEKIIYVVVVALLAPLLFSRY